MPAADAGTASSSFHGLRHGERLDKCGAVHATANMLLRAGRLLSCTCANGGLTREGQEV